MIPSKPDSRSGGGDTAVSARLKVGAAFWVVWLLTAGCSGGGGVAGVYHAQSSLGELILNSDGTYRILIGERTGAGDRQGRYTVAGNSVSLADARGVTSRARLSGRVLTIGGQSYTKE